MRMGKNTRNTTAKERMLKKIRQALLQKKENPYPQFEDAPLYRRDDTPLAVLFAEKLTEHAGNFVFCENELQLMENLLGLIEQKNLRRIHVWESALQEIMDRYELPYYKTDQELASIEMGITSCEALIARQGSVLVSNANASGRRLSSFAPIHVVFAHANQLLPDIKDGMTLLKKKYGAKLPSSISLITGPSRTADIEKTLVLGAHGPRELYVFLMDY